MKVYLSPSMQTANLYAAGGTNEQIQCNRIALAAQNALLRCGFEVKKAPEGQSMEKNVTESNAWGADIHVPIHTNAGGGRGCVVFVGKPEGERLRYGKAVYDEIDAVTLYRSVYGVREQRFYEIVYSAGMCLYVECEFHDDPVLAAWIIANPETLGEAICRGICKAAGVEYISEGSEEMERWKKLDDIPATYRGIAERFINAGALRGKGELGLDVTEDMLRVMEIIRRYFEEA